MAANQMLESLPLNSQVLTKMLQKFKKLFFIGLIFFTNIVYAAKTPVIIDTDMASDDWMATLYLLKQPKVDVKAITVVGTGFSDCKYGAQTALKLLKLVNYPQIPVACGRETPLQGNQVVPNSLRDQMDKDLGISLPSTTQTVLKESAVELLHDQLQQSKQKVVIVAIGPLTNLAQLVQKYPQITNKIAMTDIMGGAVNVPGNVHGYIPSYSNTTAEWNMYLDPKAASIYFNSGAPITLVPLDVTNTVVLDQTFFQRLEQNRQTPEAQFIYQALKQSESAIRAGQYYFWDPLAAAIAVHKHFYKTQTMQLEVIDQPGPNWGRTVVSPQGVKVRVVNKVNTVKFKNNFLKSLNR